jgi:hypothetical protein
MADPRPRAAPAPAVLLMMAAGFGITLGAFLPWAKASLPLATISQSAVDSKDGWLIAVLGIAVFLLGGSLLQRRRAAVRVAVGVIALAVVAVCVYAFTDIKHVFDEVNSITGPAGDILDISPRDLVDTSYGAGLYLTAASAVAGIVAALLVEP